MNKNIFLFISFGCLGTTIEVCFTAINKFIINISTSNSSDFSLQGKSYIWMFFIYGLGSIIFPFVFNLIQNYPLIVRILFYSLGIFSVEFVTGFILDKTLGRCPWHYDNKFSVLGYIRLDYIFYWMGFGFLLEIVYKTLSKIIEQGLM